MRMYGQFFNQQHQIPQVNIKQSFSWMTHGGQRGETEAMLCAGMEQTLVTNNKQHKIFKMDCLPLCCLCQKKDEMVRHIVSSCCKLEGTKYTKRHKNIAHYVNWNMLKERDIPVTKQWYKHSPITSVMDGNITITWDLKM
eukprot:7970200-Ditylum_brightwellii.AAC.1